MNTNARTLNIVNSGSNPKISVTHVTIRQSISVFILRLVVIELFSAIFVIVFFVFLISADSSWGLSAALPVVGISFFVLFVLAKTVLIIFIIIQWLNECYEITPKEIVHKRGLFFKKEERNVLNHLAKLEIDQGVFGRIFNYGTIKLYNWVSEKNVILSLIHNPMKYHQLLQEILPEADREKQSIREYVIEPEEVRG